MAQLEMQGLIEQHLSQGKPARSFVLPSNLDASAEFLPPLLSNLMTAKPTMFVANVSEKDLTTPPVAGGPRAVDKLKAYADTVGSRVVMICGKIESEIAELPSEDREVYLKDLGLTESGLDRMAIEGYKLLNLLTFFTVGPKETHAWTVSQGSSAPQAAGKIHTDFERGFIRAEVVSYEDYVAYSGEVKAREAGKLRTEGKEYVMHDGDIVHFRFNV